MVNRNERLERLREMVEDEEYDIHPRDLVETWEGWRPNYEFEVVEKDVEQMVPVDGIVGTDPMNTDRLVERRLVKIVNKLAEGEWEPRRDPVDLVKYPNGGYYVCSDGNHRVLAHKYFGYDEIYAEVTTYERA